MKSTTVPPARILTPDGLTASVVNGKYRIISLVASGGMGKIYQAEQIALGRMVALKVLHTKTDTHDDDSHQFRRRFLREASILARLQHPNIVTVFDYGAIEGTEEEQFFIAMEFLHGETLAKRIATQTSLRTIDTVRIARQIARGLTEAHAEGVIHRDLKPSNVMLLPGRDGEELVKIVDFGIVKVLGEDTKEDEDLTRDGTFVGSPKYTAPEQIVPDGKVDTRTDIYSLGIILYECLTGTVPFNAGGAVHTLMAHVHEIPQPMRERAPGADIPDWLDKLVMACMEKDLEKRPPTMDIVAKTLADAEAAFMSSRLMSAMSTRSSGYPVYASNIDAPPSSTSRGAVSLQSTPIVINDSSISAVRLTPATSDMTPDAMASASRRSKSKSPFVVGVSASALVIATLGFLSLRHRETSASNSEGATSPAVVQVRPNLAVAAATPPLDRFNLIIESAPAGADVHEGAHLLGVTPLELPIDNDSVRATPRSFLISKDGFAPYPLTEGPAHDSVHVMAALSPTPTVVAPSSPSIGRRSASRASTTQPASSPAVPPPAVPAASHPSLDIRLNR